MLGLISKIGTAFPIGHESTSSMPFIFVNASSGYGKTQMTFNLLKTGRTVHFIPCIEMETRTQSIYRCFGLFADIFLTCIEWDMQILDKKRCLYECDSFSYILLEYVKLSIYGFILALLSDDKCYRGPALRRDVIKALHSLGPSNHPVIFLDEFPRLLRGRDNQSNEN